MTFTPRLDVLPQAQRALWTALGDLPDSLVLYGGTALALRLGHRSSVDFDFFSSDSLDVDALFELPCFADAEVLQREPDTLTVSTEPSGHSRPVRVSLFGGIDTGRVGEPQRTDDGVVLVASLLDLLGTKLKVLLQRVAARDYLDLAAILRSGVPLEDGLGAAVALYGNHFPPMEAVKAWRTSARATWPRSMRRPGVTWWNRPVAGISRYRRLPAPRAPSREGCFLEGDGSARGRSVDPALPRRGSRRLIRPGSGCSMYMKGCSPWRQHGCRWRADRSVQGIVVFGMGSPRRESGPRLTASS